MASRPDRAIGDLERTRATVAQLGVVAEADYARARVRVRMAGLTSAWLPWLTSRAGGDRTWAAPEVGEQVLVVCPDGDPARGVVVGTVYQQDHPAPAGSADVTRTVYADGAVVEYDRGTHRLRATLPSGGRAEITAPAGATLTAPGGVVVTAADGGVQITGDTTITGALTVSQVVTAQQGVVAGGGSGATISVSGNLVVNGQITSTGDQVAGTSGTAISQLSHRHTGVTPGGGISGVPVP